MKRLSVFLLCLFTTYFLQAELCSFSGKAFDAKGQLLFQEEYVVEKQGDKIQKVQTQFLSPKGDKLGLMSSYFENANFLPKVEFKKNQSSFEYGVKLFEKSIELFKKNSSAALKKKKLTQQDNMVAGHGFYFYILDKLDSLLQGEKHQMVFVQPNRLDCYTFNMQATPLKTSKDLIQVILTIDNAFLKKIVPEIEIVIDKSTRSLVSYKGLSGFLSEEASLKTISIQYTALKSVDSSCQELAFPSSIQP
jgi:hypothetical protein